MFAKEEVNSGRQIELDVAKALAIFFMVLVHVYEVYISESYESGLADRLFEFFGSPTAAPVFMTLLGVGLVYSRRSDAKTLGKRGVKMLGLGYLLAFLRDFIPYSILAQKFQDPVYSEIAIEEMFGVDILMFAGLAFLFFSLVKKLRLSDFTLGLVWICLAVVNVFVSGIEFENVWLNRFFGLFWGTDYYSWFPFLTWISYPLFGYYFGKLLKHVVNKDEFYRKMFIGSGFLSVMLWIIAYVEDIKFGAFGELYQTEYYQHNILGSLVLCIFVLFWFSCMFYLSKILPARTIEFFKFVSKNNTRIYCYHWLVLGYSMTFLRLEDYSAWMVCVISAIIYILVHILIVALDANKKRLIVKTAE